MTDFKYHENEHLAKALQHIEKTYNQHYMGEDNIQYMDVVMAQDDALGMLKYTAPKYIMRYGKKKGYNIEDVYKAIHFLVFLLEYTEKRNLNNNETDSANNKHFEELLEDK